MPDTSVLVASTSTDGPEGPAPWVPGRDGMVAAVAPWPWVASRPRRQTALRWLTVALVGIAVGVLVERLGTSGPALAALSRADPIWLACVVVLAVSGYVLSAVGLRAATTRSLPLGRTVAAQFAAAFANRMTVGGAGGVVTNVRYLEDCGSTRVEAVSALSLQWLVRVVVHVVAIVIITTVAGPTVPIGLSMPDPPDWWVVVGALLAGLAVASLARWGVPLCRRLLAHASIVLDSVVAAARAPRRIVVLAVCAAGSMTASAVGLFLSLRAVGAAPPAAGVATVYLATSAVATLIPTPGGVGAVEAALVAGVIGLGMLPGPALAGVLIFRLVTYMLGLVPGAVAYQRLAARRHI